MEAVDLGQDAGGHDLVAWTPLALRVDDSVEVRPESPQVDQIESEPADVADQDAVVAIDELAAELGGLVAVERPLGGPDAAADAVARLEEHHLEAVALELVGGDEPRQAHPHDR